MSSQTHESSHEAADASVPHVHVVSPKVLVAVFAALMVLTWATVAAYQIDLGTAGNVFVALLIAVVKAALVALYFMHLRWDNLFNGIVLISALLFVAVFMGITLMDTAEYQPNLMPATSPESTAAP